MYLSPISWQQSGSGHHKPSHLDHYCSLPTGPPGSIFNCPSLLTRPIIEREIILNIMWTTVPFYKILTPSLCPWNKILTPFYNLQFPTLWPDPPSTASLHCILPWLSWAPATGALYFLVIATSGHPKDSTILVLTREGHFSSLPSQSRWNLLRVPSWPPYLKQICPPHLHQHTLWLVHFMF